MNSLLFVTHRPNLIMTKGEGVYLWDKQGKKYLDFIGGWAVNTLGHSPKELVDAISEQAQILINGSPAFYNEPMIEFADQLVHYSCLDKAFFCSTGAEANECAIKLARKYGQKFKNGAFEIVTVKGSFHGRTLATMSATGKEKWKTLFEPKVPGFKQIDLNDSEQAKKAVNANTAAIMLELIQGEGGVHEVDPSFLENLSELCRKEKILLIIDEVQTGFGRTGKLFAYQHYNIQPDIVTLGKGIGGGYPLAAVLVKEALDIFEPGDQGGTYTAQPLGMAVGLRILKTLHSKHILENAAQKGESIKQALAKLSSEFPIKDIRGKGLLIGCSLEILSANEVVKQCLEEGLIINATDDQTIRFVPPLIIEDQHIEEMKSKLRKVLINVRNGA